MELLIPLKNHDTKPLYEQICQHIKNEIRCGSLKPGKQMPSSRKLAENLKVSRSTTQLAYELLVSEGYLEVIPKKGHFVAQIDGLFAPIRRQEEEGNVSLPEKKEPFFVDFSPWGIDLESFPFSAWRKISRRVLQEEEKEMFLKGDPKGDRSLRRAIRDYLHNARGVNCSAEQIVVGAGNEYLFMLLSRLLGEGCEIAMEDPTYKQAYRVLSGMGHQICPTAMDENGMLVSELEKTGAKAAYVMPAHQFPMGTVMPVKRRQELLSWAAEEDGRFLIEDDYDSEFRYKGKPVPALQGFDGGGHVIYMGTFSKAIAPAIRVGYMVLPEKLLRRYEETLGFYSSTVSRLEQKILSEFIEGGYFERHLNRMRGKYKSKHDLLLSGLKSLEPRFEVAGEYAGLHVLLTAREEWTENEIIGRAKRAGVKVYGLSELSICPENKLGRAAVLLGYGGLKEEEIKSGIRLLKDAFSADL